MNVAITGAFKKLTMPRHHTHTHTKQMPRRKQLRPLLLSSAIQEAESTITNLTWEPVKMQTLRLQRITMCFWTTQVPASVWASEGPLRPPSAASANPRVALLLSQHWVKHLICYAAFFSFPFFVFFFHHFSHNSLHVDKTNRTVFHNQCSWSQQSDLLVFSALFTPVNVLGSFHWCVGLPTALNRRCQTAECQLSGGIHRLICK